MVGARVKIDGKAWVNTQVSLNFNHQCSAATVSIVSLTPSTFYSHILKFDAALDIRLKDYF